MTLTSDVFCLVTLVIGVCDKPKHTQKLYKGVEHRMRITKSGGFYHKMDKSSFF